MSTTRSTAILLVVVFAGGLVLGVAGYALVGPNRGTYDPLVQAAFITLIGAVVGGLALGVGTLLASHVGAEATARQVETASGDAARAREEAATARAQDRQDFLAGRAQDREDAATARFADRIRELAARLQLGAVAVVRVMGEDIVADGAKTDEYSKATDFYEVGQELQIIVRKERTYLAVQILVGAVSAAEEYIRRTRKATAEGKTQFPGVSGLGSHLNAVINAYNELQNAVRAEFGLPDVPMEAKLTAFKESKANYGPQGDPSLVEPA